MSWAWSKNRQTTTKIHCVGTQKTEAAPNADQLCASENLLAWGEFLKTGAFVSFQVRKGPKISLLWELSNGGEEG